MASMENGDDAKAKDLKSIHELAVKRFDAVAIPQREMREQALQARRFAFIPGAQWDGEWGQAFANSIRVQVNKVRRAYKKIENDYRQNRLVPDFRPDGPNADQSTADTLDGMYRADAYHFKSAQALDNAVQEGISGGMGAFRLCNDYDDEDDPENDYQRVNPGLIITDADQNVYFDGNAKAYDKSDANWCFVLTSFTKEAFNAEFGEDKQSNWPEPTLRQEYDWFTPEVIRVADYYVKVKEKDTLLVMKAKLTGEIERAWKSDLDDDDVKEKRALGWKITEQKRDRVRVRKYVMSGAEVLKDCGFIAGKHIPVVPVYGERQFIDGQERFKGIVADMMDPQRVYNSQMSRLAEISALSPLERPIFTPDQLPPALQTLWAESNINRHPYALAMPVHNPDGSIAQLGPIGYVKPPDVPPALAALMQIANADLADETTDSSEQVRANVSADAMDIAAMRVDAKSGDYLDNIRQSVQRQGEIYFGMASEVYVEEGRKAKTMTEDGDDGEAIIKEPYTDEQGVFGMRNDFTRGKYKVIASVTEATATRRDKTVRSMLKTAEIAAAAGSQDIAQAALITAVMNQDGEGIDGFQKYVRRAAVQQGIVEPNDEEKAQLQQEAENVKPDPAAMALEAQAEELQASAELKLAQADKAVAETALAEARALEIMHKPIAPRDGAPFQ